MSKRILQITLWVLAVAVAVISIVSIGKPSLAKNSQDTPRVNVKETVLPGNGVQPVKISEFILGTGENWLKGFTIEVENLTDKPVYYFEYSFVIPSPKPGEPSVGYKFIFNPELAMSVINNRKLPEGSLPTPLAPHAKTRLTLPEKFADPIRNAVEKKQPLGTAKNIHCTLQFAFFGDDQWWDVGNLGRGSRPALQSKLDSKSRQSLASLISKVNYTVPAFYDGCQACGGPCGTYSFTGRFLCPAPPCSVEASINQYTKIGPGTVSPQPMGTPCPDNPDLMYNDCTTDTCIRP